MNSGWRERRLFSLEGNTSFFSAPTPTRARSVTILQGVLLTAISPAGISISMLSRARLVTLLRGVLRKAMSTASVSIPMHTRAPTAQHLANSHPASRRLNPDAHQSSYFAASCRQPSHQLESRSRHSPKLQLRGVLPTAIPPAAVWIAALIRAR